ncbi:jg25773 [Pararge aegeria aegeria]|uniref:Jg25773 protein n=1 Tax=Pararge aegeria aegeria TaxID=348720 RepID=A0A8S4QSC7_9NEOP|nr:jg25773 [Pararge aegeria aegeria]
MSVVALQGVGGSAKRPRAINPSREAGRATRVVARAGIASREPINCIALAPLLGLTHSGQNSDCSTTIGQHLSLDISCVKAEWILAFLSYRNPLIAGESAPPAIRHVVTSPRAPPRHDCALTLAND